MNTQNSGPRELLQLSTIPASGTKPPGPCTRCWSKRNRHGSVEHRYGPFFKGCLEKTNTSA